MAKKQDQGTAAVEQPTVTDQQAADQPAKRTPEEIEAEIKATQERIKALRAEKKGEKPKKDKAEPKGKMVSFLNKAGERITGLGNLYYVVRANGRLNYKAADATIVLPEGWKEGDPIPGVESENLV